MDWLKETALATLSAIAITTSPISANSVTNCTKSHIDILDEMWEKQKKVCEMSQAEIMLLASELSEKKPIKYDLSKLSHTASLSPEIMKKYFDWNKVTYPAFKPSKSWEIDEKWWKPTVEWNLQYLIWKTGVSTYLTLSDEHQNFIQEIADIILTDEYVQNIEEHKKDKKIPYDIVSSWEKYLKTNNLSFFVMKVVYLLKDIQEIRSWVDSQFSRAEKLLNKYQEKKWYNIPEELLQKLDELKPEIENIIKIHKLLDEQGLKNTMDFRKKEQVLNDEISRIKKEINKNESIIKWNEDIIKNNYKEIKKLKAYLDTLKRLRKALWISE